MAECMPWRPIGWAILLVELAGASLVPSLARAQPVGGATGAISGTVTDSTGAVLPGVAITLSSAALIGNMGIRKGSTDAEGLYWFAALPTGEYRLEFTLDGFTTEVREALYVSVGLTATIDIRMAVATLREQVVVERGAPVINRESTAIGTTFDARQLAEVPGSRSMVALIMATPSVLVGRIDVAGNIEHPGLYVAYGIGGQNQPMVEGMIVSGILGTGFTLNYGSFEEVAVGTAAHGPEWPMAGVQMQFIAKSGGNRYRGAFYADYLDRDWQSFNVDADQIRRGAAAGGALSPRDVNRLWSRFDVNADAGGFIRKDSLWWYGSARKEEVSALAVNFPVEPRRTRITNYTGKITYRLAPAHKLIAFVQTGRDRQAHRLEPFNPLGGSLNAMTAIHQSEESTADQLARGRVWKMEWNAVAGQTLFLDVRAGQFDTTRREMPHSASPRFEDVGNHLVRGGSRDSQQDLRRDQLFGSLSYFRTGWLGNHHVKLGGEVLRGTATEIWRQGYPGDVLHVLQNGVPRQVYLFETPSRSVNGVWFYAAYVSDTWRVNRRLTATLGLRFDRSRVFLPEQAHADRFNSTVQRFPAVNNVIDWNVFAPRMGLNYDLAGDGRTIAKFSWSRYWVPPGTDVGSNVNPNANQWWRSYEWTDPDGSGLWERGEEGHENARRGGAGVESLDANLELSYVNEAAVGIERELPGRVGLRTGVVWRGARQPRARQNRNWPFEAFSVPVAIPDPGPDNLRGTGDDGPVIQAVELRADLRDSLPVENIVRNVPGADSTYWTWDIIATRRFAGRWSLTAGFSHTWNRSQANAYFGQVVRNNPVPLTPNDLINTAGHGAHVFTTWTLKAYGTYELPGDIRLTPLLRHQSGQPFGRTFVTALNYGPVRILAEPIDTRRMDHIAILDLHGEKGFHVPGSGRVSAFVDVFNVLNANPEENTSWSSGDSFMRPLGIVAPRVARVGAKLEW